MKSSGGRKCCRPGNIRRKGPRDCGTATVPRVSWPLVPLVPPVPQVLRCLTAPSAFGTRGTTFRPVVLASYRRTGPEAWVASQKNGRTTTGRQDDRTTGRAPGTFGEMGPVTARERPDKRSMAHVRFQARKMSQRSWTRTAGYVALGQLGGQTLRRPEVCAERLTDKATSARGVDLYRWSITGPNHWGDCLAGAISCAIWHRWWDATDVVPKAVPKRERAKAGAVPLRPIRRKAVAKRRRIRSARSE